MGINALIWGRPTGVVCLTAVVAACAPTAAIKEIAAPSVTVRQISNSSAPEVRRLVTVPMETRSAGNLVSADCILTTPFYTAKFRSPANLQLPDYGDATPAVTVSCTGDAGQGKVTAPAVSVDSHNAAIAGSILLGPILGGAMTGVTVKTDGQYYYRAIGVALRK